MAVTHGADQEIRRRSGPPSTGRDGKEIPPPRPGSVRPLRPTRGLKIPTAIGPAFIAAVAYVDPGNYATNFAAGSGYGFMLVWVLLAANLAAMPIQYLSARLGLATNKTLPQLCRQKFGQKVCYALWLQAEVVAMATELAELVGTALALNILTGVPILWAGLIGASVSFVILTLSTQSRRGLEVVITGFLAMIVVAFLVQVFLAKVAPAQVLAGIQPRLAGTGSVMLAVGIIGATIMPHAIYVHSSVTVGRGGTTARRRAEILRTTRLDVIIALSVAGVVNLSMLAISATLFRGAGEDLTIQQAHQGIGIMLGAGAAFIFAAALLASGIASTVVGAYAGEVIMTGFTGWRIDIAMRRFITIAPSIVVLGLGVDPTMALVISQVVLSFGIPFALVPLVMISMDRKIMGKMVPTKELTYAVMGITAVVISLNGFLIYQQFFGSA